jgi:proteasome lid subunit RPN8/RPN11
MLSLTPALLTAIQAHGEAAYPNEGAGLLLGQATGSDKTLTAILPIANKWEAEEQFHSFLITPDDMLRGETEAARRGLDVIGIFHSHPDHVAVPSGFDQDWALPWYSYIITSIEKASAVSTRSWLLREDRSGFEEEALALESPA